jgi:hypothetical protein
LPLSADLAAQLLKQASLLKLPAEEVPPVAAAPVVPGRRPQPARLISPKEQALLAEAVMQRLYDRIEVRDEALAAKHISCVCDRKNGDICQLKGSEGAAFDIKLLAEHPTLDMVDFAGCYGMYGEASPLGQ